MTGFARENGTTEIDGVVCSWFWELKSVNGKSLEVKTKIPFWLDAVSVPAKIKISQELNRGNVYACLEVETQNLEPKLKINEVLLQQLSMQAIDLYKKNSDYMQKPNPADILSVKGVVELEEQDLCDEQLSLLQNEILNGLDKTLKTFIADRQSEGAKIENALLKIVDKIADEVSKIELIAKNIPTQQKEKLMLQLEQLLEPTMQLSEERLAQEIVLLVNKSDITEEIDRLNAHIKTARALFGEGGNIGRRLDFLCQELNRETNTICSKSVEIELTNCGMQLKTLIEQFREQVQNIE